jgi:hypothetical protein
LSKARVVETKVARSEDAIVGRDTAIGGPETAVPDTDRDEDVRRKDDKRSDGQGPKRYALAHTTTKLFNH